MSTHLQHCPTMCFKANLLFFFFFCFRVWFKVDVFDFKTDGFPIGGFAFDSVMTQRGSCDAPGVWIMLSDLHIAYQHALFILCLPLQLVQVEPFSREGLTSVWPGNLQGSLACFDIQRPSDLGGPRERAWLSQNARLLWERLDCRWWLYGDGAHTKRYCHVCQSRLWPVSATCTFFATGKSSLILDVIDELSIKATPMCFTP